MGADFQVHLGPQLTRTEPTDWNCSETPLRQASRGLRRLKALVALKFSRLQGEAVVLKGLNSIRSARQTPSPKHYTTLHPGATAK